MPTPAYYPSNLQWLGLAKETAYGVPAAAPLYWVPVDTPKWTPKITVHTDQALRGMMSEDYQQVQGMRFDELTYKTYGYLDTIYPHLLAILGNPDTISGTAAPYTHKTSLYNGSGTNGAQPPSWTGFYIDAAGKCWQIPGMMLADLKLATKVDDLDTVDATWNGLAATAIAIPTNTPTTLPPMPAWNSVISVAGSAVSAYSEVSIDLKRNVKPVNTINNSQTPLGIFSGGLAVSGSLTAVYQGSADTNLADFIANTQPALSVKWQQAGDAVHSLTLQCSTCAFDSAEPQGGTDWMEIQAAFKALANSTDALDTKLSPAQAILVGTQATAY